MFSLLLAPLSKALIANLLKDSVKSKVLAELRDAAEDPRSRVKRDLVDALDHAWDDLWGAVADGLRR